MAEFIQPQPPIEVPSMQQGDRVVGHTVGPGGVTATNNGGFEQRRGATGDRQLPWMAGKWAKLAEKVKDYPTVMEAMHAGGLDWTVKKVPIYSAVLDFNGVGYREVEDKFGIERSDTHEILGVTGKVFAPWQNEELATYTDVLCDTTASTRAGMGSIKGGRRVFTAVKLDRDLTPPGMPDEDTRAYLVTTNGHDGGLSISSSILVFRWACYNGLIGLVPEMSHSFKIRHTRTAKERIAIAAKAMSRAHQYLDKHAAITEELLKIQMSADATNDMIEALIPKPHIKDPHKQRLALRRCNRKRLSLVRWIPASDNLANIRGTGYGFVQAVAEWDQWAKDQQKNRSLPAMERMINDDGNNIVARARELVLARV